MKSIYFSIVFSLLITTGFAQTIPADSLYFRQTPPGNLPKVFAPGSVSFPNVTENLITFSPNGNELFLDTGIYPNRTILHKEYINNKWSKLELATFSINKKQWEPVLSLNGTRVYYSNSQLMYCEKQNTTWSSPFPLSIVNFSSGVAHPCIVKDTSLYFSSGNGEIFRSQYLKGIYQKPIKLPTIINTGISNRTWADAFIAPNESYIIFNSNRSGGYGDIDLYISYKKENGSWTNPKNLGDKINTSKEDWDGDITPDGKYMTFSRNGDIYWVSTSFIDSLEHTNFIPYLKNQIISQTDSISHSFSFTIPDTAFIDDDGNNTLTYSATLSNNKPLPSWLSFNPATKTFSGILDSIGTFKIIVTATDIAKASVSTTFTLKVVGNPTSITNPAFGDNIQVYPNPAKDKINISFGPMQYKTALVKISDISGKLISSDTYHNLSNASIDLTGNPKGVYILNLRIDGEQLSKKICIE